MSHPKFLHTGRSHLPTPARRTIGSPCTPLVRRAGGIAPLCPLFLCGARLCLGGLCGWLVLVECLPAHGRTKQHDQDAKDAQHAQRTA